MSELDPETTQMTFDPSSPTGVGGPMEEEAAEKLKYFFSLDALRNQIRRTDVEMRHLTKDMDLKEFETKLLRSLTLMKQFALFATYLPWMADPATMPFALVMMGMGAATSAGTMQEIS